MEYPIEGCDGVYVMVYLMERGVVVSVGVSSGGCVGEGVGGHVVYNQVSRRAWW